MKNIILLLSILCFSARTALSQENMSPKANNTGMECCVMKKGKMVCIKDGKEVPMKKEMKMNGVTVMPDGTCITQNGKISKLKEGQCCDRKGKIHSDCKD